MKNTATVETLTAQVQVLMVGSRQVTLSVARQLDSKELYANLINHFEPFGRVRTGAKRNHFRKYYGDTFEIPEYEWVGYYHGDESRSLSLVFAFEDNKYKRYWEHLPLIVLAGLK